MREFIQDTWRGLKMILFPVILAALFIILFAAAFVFTPIWLSIGLWLLFILIVISWAVGQYS